jgi:large subunit ribosomal protein L32
LTGLVLCGKIYLQFGHNSKFLIRNSKTYPSTRLSINSRLAQGEFFGEKFMGVPKKHKTRSGRDQRRSHHALKKTSFAVCKNCGHSVMPHLPCKNCGYYKGRKVTK